VEKMSDRRTWTIDRCDVDGGPGCRGATLAVVDPEGDVAALADLEGAAPLRSVEVSLQLVAKRPPREVLGELARAAARLAAEWGGTRMVVRLAPCDRMAHDLLDTSGLEWRMLPRNGSACAEVSLPPVEPPRAGPSRSRS
jgi:hypothetical protein